MTHHESTAAKGNSPRLYRTGLRLPYSAAALPAAAAPARLPAPQAHRDDRPNVQHLTSLAPDDPNDPSDCGTSEGFIICVGLTPNEIERKRKRSRFRTGLTNPRDRNTIKKSRIAESYRIQNSNGRRDTSVPSITRVYREILGGQSERHNGRTQSR